MEFIISAIIVLFGLALWIVYSPIQPAKQVSVSSAVADATPAEQPRMGMSDYASVVRINEGPVFLYFFKKSKTVRRVFHVRSEELAAKVGHRVELPSLSFTEAPTKARAEQITKADALVFVQDALASAVTARTADSVRPVDVQADQEAVEQAPLAVVEGRLKRFGMDLFPHQEPNAKNPSKSFFVELETDQGKKRMWGVDLQRAVVAANAEIGTNVRVRKYPKQPVIVNDDGREKRVLKNIFDITVVEPSAA